MTCGDKFNRNCPTGGSKVDPAEVPGRACCRVCSRPLLGDGFCTAGCLQELSPAAWSTPASTYLEGWNVPPELYNGLPTTHGGVLRVLYHADGRYTVIHDMGGLLRAPLVTHGDSGVAGDMCTRYYGHTIQNETADLVGQHRRVVQQALRWGYAVPEAVLQEYPDLRASFAVAHGGGLP